MLSIISIKIRRNEFVIHAGTSAWNRREFLASMKEENSKLFRKFFIDPVKLSASTPSVAILTEVSEYWVHWALRCWLYSEESAKLGAEICKLLMSAHESNDSSSVYMNMLRMNTESFVFIYIEEMLRLHQIFFHQKRCMLLQLLNVHVPEWFSHDNISTCK